MKIYFAGSIRGGRNDKDLYMDIINYLSNYGQVLTEHVGDPNLRAFGEDTLSDKGIYDRDMDWMMQSDIVVAEVTTPSLGVGYEIGKAEDLKKQILCLYRNQPGKRLSAMISGSPNVENVTYENLEEAKVLIDNFFKNLDR
jgi:nucleoside 2-deoxyribosyltransferase